MMLKARKWKGEKSKAKAQFKLQFTATQVPYEGWDKLSVNLVPYGSEKIIAKTEKASISNGACQWSQPIYESIHIEKDSKTGGYTPKRYNLVVSTGSSWYAFLGETIINLSEYIGALTPLSVKLPLTSCKAGTILHVTILQIKEKFKGSLKERDQAHRLLHVHSMAPALTEHVFPDRTRLSESASSGHDSESYIPNLQGNSLITSKGQVSSGSGSSDFSFGHDLNGRHSHYNVSDAASYSSSGSSCSDKQERIRLHDMIFRKNEIPQDPASSHSCISQYAKLPRSVSDARRTMIHTKQEETKTNYSMQNRNSNQTKGTNFEEIESLQAKLQSSESANEELRKEVEDLRSKVASLEKHDAQQSVEMEALKMQLSAGVQQGQDLLREISTLTAERDCLKAEVQQGQDLSREISTVAADRDYVKAEAYQGEDLSREISDLTAERDDLKAELEQLKASACNDRKAAETSLLDMGNMLERLEQELEYEKQRNLDISLQLQKTQESNNELILAVQELETILGGQTSEIKETPKELIQISSYDPNDDSGPLDDVDMEWMQSFSSLENTLKELIPKTNLSSDVRSLNFIQERLNSLQIALHDAKQDVVSMVFKLKNELNTHANMFFKLESDLHQLLSKIDSSKMKQDDMDNKTEISECQNFNFEANKELGHNRVHNLQKMIVQVEKDWSEVIKQRQELQDEIKRYKLDVEELEKHLMMVDEEAQALAEANQILEEKVEILESEKANIENSFNASHEAGMAAQNQIEKIMQEMSLLSPNTEPDNGIKEGKYMHTSGTAEGIAISRSKLHNLPNPNTKLLKIISELERVLKHDKERSHNSDKERDQSYSQLEAKFIQVYEEAKDNKKARDHLESEMQRMEEQYELLKQEHALCSTQAKNTNNKLEYLKDQNATSLTTISILESKVSGLQEEIDSQAKKFSEDLNALLQTKRELEHRANVAEEGLKRAKCDNTIAVEQIQENFAKVSQQMSSAFEAKEQLASEALKEASELRLEKAILQDSLRKAEEDFESLKRQFQEEVEELTMQLDKSKKEGETLSTVLRNTSRDLERQKGESDEHRNRIEELLIMLDGLQVELNACTAQKLEIHSALQTAEKEKFKSEEEVRSLKEHLKNLEEELTNLKICKDANESVVSSLEFQIKEQASQITAYNDALGELSESKSKYEEVRRKKFQKDSKLESSKKQFAKMKTGIQTKASTFDASDRKRNEGMPKTRAAGESLKNTQTHNKVAVASSTTKELFELRNRVKKLEDEIMSKTKALEEANRQVSLKEKDLKIQAEELEAMRHRIKQEMDSKEAIRKDLKNQAEELEAIRLRIKQEMDGKEVIEEDLKIQAEELEAIRHRIKQEMESKEVLRKDLKNKAEELETLRLRIRQEVESKEVITKDLKTQAEELEAMRHRIKQEMDRNVVIGKELEGLRIRHAQLLEQEKNLQSNLRSQESLIEEIQRLRKANAELQSKDPSFVEHARYEQARNMILVLEKELEDSYEAHGRQKRELQSGLEQLQAEASKAKFEREELKSHNSIMEEELKDLQQRYYSMSLKCAEVEVERQRLAKMCRS